MEKIMYILEIFILLNDMLLKQHICHDIFKIIISIDFHSSLDFGSRSITLSYKLKHVEYY